MAEERMNNIYGALLSFTLVAAVLVGWALIFYVSIHDYAGVPLIDVGDALVSQGKMEQVYVTAMEDILIFTERFPEWLDYLFLLLFGTFSTGLLISSYRIKRVGYFTFYSLAVIGCSFVLFLLSFYIETAEWFTELFFSAIPSITPQIPIFTWYITNAGVINMVLVFLTLILNFIDLDLNKFKTRKDKELINDEI